MLLQKARISHKKGECHEDQSSQLMSEDNGLQKERTRYSHSRSDTVSLNQNKDNVCHFFKCERHTGKRVFYPTAHHSNVPASIMFAVAMSARAFFAKCQRHTSLLSILSVKY